ncbi:MAG: alginate lyase family protein, partial [Planctomycetes bacterium]|nr:alginate lyase family protein [Planctomycetota bacterium]
VNIMAGNDELVSRGQKLLAQQCGKIGAFFAISDQDLFASMDLERPGLGEVRDAVGPGDYDAAYQAWGRYWASRGKPVWYLEDTTYAQDLEQYLPQAKAIIITKADRIWSADFKHSTYAPKRQGRTFQWADNSTSDTAYIGFHYWFWAGELGRAYLLTGDEKYPAMFRELVCSWWDALPRMAAHAKCGSANGINVVWNSGLGSSIRALVMADGYWLSRRSPAFTTELHRKILRIFLGHARYMYDTHMGRYNHSNFQASQCCWMAAAGILLPEFRDAPKWLDVAVRLTKERIRKNYTEDGFQLELCPQYHFTGMRDITRVVWLLRRNNMGHLLAEGDLLARLERIYDLPIRLAHPTGHGAVMNSGVYGTEWQTFMPIGMQLFDSKLHAWAAKRFIAADFVPVAKNISEYVQFMDGPWVQALRQAREIDLPLPKFVNDLLKQSGIAVLRSGWERDALAMVFDFCRDPYGGHAYPGRLSFDLWAYGKALVVNPGSTLSYSMPEYGQWCHRTRGHNTVLVNNQDQARPHRAELRAWHDGQHVVFVAAATDTYLQSAGVSHERSIISVKNEYFLIFDLLLGGRANTQVAWLMHSPSALQTRDNGAICSGPDGPGLLIVPDTETRKDSQVALGKSYAAVPVSYHDDYTPLDAWRDDIAFLKLTRTIREADAGQTFAVLLMPFAKAVPEIEVSRQASPAENTYVLQITQPDYQDELTIDCRSAAPTFEMTRYGPGKSTIWAERGP